MNTYATVNPGMAVGCLECTDNYYYEGKPLSSYPYDEQAELLSNGECPDEGFCSSAACDLCGDTLQGNRYHAHAFVHHDDTDYVHIDICENCLFNHPDVSR